MPTVSICIIIKIGYNEANAYTQTEIHSHTERKRRQKQQREYISKIEKKMKTETVWPRKERERNARWKKTVHRRDIINKITIEKSVLSVRLCRCGWKCWSLRQTKMRFQRKHIFGLFSMTVLAFGNWRNKKRKRFLFSGIHLFSRLIGVIWTVGP